MIDKALRRVGFHIAYSFPRNYIQYTSCVSSSLPIPTLILSDAATAAAASLRKPACSVGCTDQPGGERNKPRCSRHAASGPLAMKLITPWPYWRIILVKPLIHQSGNARIITDGCARNVIWVRAVGRDGFSKPIVFRIHIVLGICTIILVVMNWSVKRKRL